MEKREALVETGRIRLRPILMTAMTTILGMSTMALGRGTGAEMMQPMAVVSIGGLSYATLMTLFIVPVLYDLLNGKNMKAREIQMIKEAAGMNGDGTPDSADGPIPPAEAPAQAVPVEAATAPEACVGEAPAIPQAIVNEAPKRDNTAAEDAPPIPRALIEGAWHPAPEPTAEAPAPATAAVEPAPETADGVPAAPVRPLLIRLRR